MATFAELETKYANRKSVDRDIAPVLKTILDASGTEYETAERNLTTVFFFNQDTAAFASAEKQAKQQLNAQREADGHPERDHAWPEIPEELKLTHISADREIDYLRQHTQCADADIKAFVQSEIQYVTEKYRECREQYQVDEKGIADGAVDDYPLTNDRGLNLIWFISLFVLHGLGEDGLLTVFDRNHTPVRYEVNYGPVFDRCKKETGLYFETMETLFAAQHEILYRDYPENWLIPNPDEENG